MSHRVAKKIRKYLKHTGIDPKQVQYTGRVYQRVNPAYDPDNEKLMQEKRIPSHFRTFNSSLTDDCGRRKYQQLKHEYKKAGANGLQIEL